MLNPSIPDTAVDLSRLPSPEVVETLDWTAIRDAMLADLVARDPAFTALVESDPAYRILEVAAYREMLIRARINDAARGVMVAYAVGGALDHLGALVQTTRFELTPADSITGAAAVMESDADFRRRIVLAPDGFSTAGPESAYRYHALSAHPQVLDAKVFSPTPGVVQVAIMSRLGNGVPTQDILDAVTDRLNPLNIRPLTDNVVVLAGARLTYGVVAQIWLYTGPDSALILANAEAGLAAYVEACRRLGRDVVDSGVKTALQVEGVQRVVLVDWTDVVTTRTQFAACTASTVTLVGYAE